MSHADNKNRDFASVFGLDLILRSTYQVGKSPVLPMFAAVLGASDALLGVIVSVSIVTGIALKPLMGMASDRLGRRSLLMVACGIFVGAPFLYLAIDSPVQLVGVRLLHGLGTAILGPVTLGWVVVLSPKRTAERLAWFGVARSLGSVVGPTVGAVLLLRFAPRDVFGLIGLASLISLPLLLMLPAERASQTRGMRPILEHLSAMVALARSSPALVVAGGIGGGMYMVLYALKAFLPAYALDTDISLLSAGVMLSAQEGTAAVLKPAAGRLADRVGTPVVVGLGMLCIGVAVVAIGQTTGATVMTGLFIAIGFGQALVGPALIAMVADQTPESLLGGSMGLLGALTNCGKVLGPVLCGLLMSSLEFQGATCVLGLGLVVFASQILRHRGRLHAIG